MNASKALELLKPIPNDQFITDHYTNEKNKCCAIGHLCRLSSSNTANYVIENCVDHRYNEVRQLRNTSRTYLQRSHSFSGDMATVNNNDDINGYNEDNPKDRVIHLLEDMVAAGY